MREETAAAQTNKTVGGDIRRYYFEKITIPARLTAALVAGRTA